MFSLLLRFLVHPQVSIILNLTEMYRKSRTWSENSRNSCLHKKRCIYRRWDHWGFKRIRQFSLDQIIAISYIINIYFTRVTCFIASHPLSFPSFTLILKTSWLFKIFVVKSMYKKSKDCDEDSSRAKKTQRVGVGESPIRSMR